MQRIDQFCVKCSAPCLMPECWIRNPRTSMPCASPSGDLKATYPEGSHRPRMRSGTRGSTPLPRPWRSSNALNQKSRSSTRRLKTATLSSSRWPRRRITTGMKNELTQPYITMPQQETTTCITQTLKHLHL